MTSSQVSPEDTESGSEVKRKCVQCQWTYRYSRVSGAEWMAGGAACRMGSKVKDSCSLGHLSGSRGRLGSATMVYGTGKRRPILWSAVLALASAGVGCANT
ncbi:MAG: hypothetical protein RL385_3319, partial [Pseudomonadota bacterium]